MTPTEPTNAATQKRWDTLSKSLERLGVEKSVMLGLPSLKFGKTAFAALFGNSLVLKLEGDTHAKALAREGASLFDPSGAGRPMPEWVVITEAHFKDWGSLAATALTAMSTTLPARRRPPKKWPGQR
jgi:hypothetical protein